MEKERLMKRQGDGQRERQRLMKRREGRWTEGEIETDEVTGREMERERLMNRQAGRVTEKLVIGEVEGHTRREKERVRERETREVDGRSGCGWLQLITDAPYIHTWLQKN